MTAVAAVAGAAPSAGTAGRTLGAVRSSSTAPRWQTARSVHPTTRRARTAARRVVLKNGEVPSLRTRSSSTFQRPNGMMQTRLSTMATHYRKHGQWIPINNALVARANGSLQNASDAMSVTLPSVATGATRASEGAAWVSMVPVGLSPVAVQSSGSQASYLGVLPSVDELFSILPDAVQQTYRLKTASAANSFTSVVTVPAGYRLAPAGDRSISLLDGAGARVASLEAPVATDSSGNIDTDTDTDIYYTITGAAPAYTVTETIARSWLSDPARVFPVLLDPSVSFGTNLDLSCLVSSTGSPSCSNNTGTDNTIAVGVSSSNTRRTYLKFGDLTASGTLVPADAVITDARLNLTFTGAVGTGSALDMTIYRPQAAWDSTITYANQPAIYPTVQEHENVAVPAVGSTVTLNPVQLVQAWVHGSIANTGMRIAAYNESTATQTYQFNGMASTHHPMLIVDYRPQVGQQKNIGAYDHQVSDRLDLHVDYGTRNLVVNAADESMQGPGQSLVVRRTYNSLAAVAGQSGAYGQGWTLNGGTDTGLEISRGTVTYTQPGGAMATFRRFWPESDLTQDDAYEGGESLNATLTMPNAGQYQLLFNKSNVLETFTVATGGTTAWLSSIANHKDGSGPTITYTATGTPLKTTMLTDTTGSRSVALSYTSGVVTGMSESLAAGATGARSWSYTYDGSGRLATSVDAAGKITQYCYNTAGLLSRLITPHGAFGGLNCYTSGGVDVIDIAYDTTGAVTSITYDGASPAVTVGFSTPTVVTSTAAGETDLTDPYSAVTKYSFDQHDQITKVITPLNVTKTSTYNPNGDVTASVDADNYTGGGSDPSTTSTYTGYNRTNVTLPGGASVSAQYNDATQTAQPSQSTDDLGHNITYTYSPGGGVKTATSGSEVVTTLRDGDTDAGTTVHCGPAGGAAYKDAVCELRDGDYLSSASTQHRTKFAYNSLGQLISITPPTPANGRTTPPTQTFTYDGQSRLASSTSGRGKTTTYSYDTMDRVTKILYNDGHYTALTYDEDGDLLTQTDKTAGGAVIASETYTYDGLNRPASETRNGTSATSTTWDGNSHLLTFADSSGTTTYGYDTAGNLTSTTLPGGSCSGYSPTNPPTTASGCIIFQNNKAGKRQITIYPGNYARQTTGYDTSGRVSRETGTAQSGGAGTTLFDYAYSYGATNHLSTRTDYTSGSAGSVKTYGYSQQGRLFTATDRNSGGTVTNVRTYCYDLAGNRTHRATGTTTAYNCATAATDTFDGANQQLTGQDGVAANYTYDLDGDETSAATATPSASTIRTNTWTDANQVASVTLNGTTSGASSHLGTTNDTLLTSGISATNYDSLRNSETGVGQVARYGTSGLISSFTVTRDPQGTILSLRDSSGTRYYPLFDNLGSILAIVDAAGNAADRYTYDPFGDQTITTNSYPQPFGYTSAYTNPTTGLIHYGARYYDPTLGRFTQTDPKLHPSDTNQSTPYPYAGDDPVNNSDPGGTDFFDDVESTANDVFNYALSGAIGGCLATIEEGCVLGAAAGGAGGIIVGLARGVSDTLKDIFS